MRQNRPDAGVTLMELLISITLLSLLSLGMAIAMQVGLAALGKTNNKLMDNRRVAGAQRIVEQELEGLMPVFAPCGAGPESVGNRIPFFQGEREAMRLVSTFSLQQGWRGGPQILEMFVIPGAEGHGVRLVVNEQPYTGPASAARLCVGRSPDPVTGVPALRFLPAVPGPQSFVLADKLAYCRFVYLLPAARPDQLPAWGTTTVGTGWPLGVRIEMAPLSPSPAQLQPITVTAPVKLLRLPEMQYADN